MTDTVSKERRSEIMRRIPRKNTKPEMIVRSTAHALGYRFRVAYKKLPGSPDVIFPGKRIVIFVHGCFWHGHEKCSLARVPKTNSEYWVQKVAKNSQRDARVIEELRALGWKSFLIWECETKDRSALEKKLKKILG